jgi:ribosomal protein L11 methyltransferase
VPRDEEPQALLEISVKVAGIDAEVAADLLRQACSGGIAIQPASRFDAASDAYVVDGDAPAVVTGYLEAGPDSERTRRSLRLALGMAPLQTPPRWRRARRLREESWRDSWKKHFGVQRIGRALVVKPSWTQYKLKGGEIVIEIDPGMAFGTGQHPTTAMCLRALEEHVRPGAVVLDVGCGSGILAIAAAKLGATRVLALDIDPNAVDATRQNAAANGAAQIVEAREGTLALESATQPDVFNIIVANISGLTLERLSPALAASLAPGGALISSGFLEDAVSGLCKAYKAAGLTPEPVIEDGVWRAIIALKT